jgi:hypothetical protein
VLVTRRFVFLCIAKRVTVKILNSYLKSKIRYTGEHNCYMPVYLFI